ncbi:Octicosapeptide/Phox/Bem1p family protein [Hirschfeldia incana]|nr:Octicosapeptide/Phox/Bem1p family protein [Hirschfeldia incana]
MTTVSSAVTEGAKAVTPRCANNTGKLRVMCRYGGSIVSLPQAKSPRYVGGDTRIVAVPPSAETSVASLVSHLAVALGISYDFKVKYQLPDQELDSLISLETDEDVQIMMEEHGYVTCESLIPKTRVRLFLFPSESRGGGASQRDPVQCKPEAAVEGDVDWLGIGESSNPSGDEMTQPVLQHPKTDTWFVDALKGVEMMQTGGNNNNNSGSSGGSGGICGQESMMLETNSSFGSTSSSVSSSRLPLMKSTGEDNNTSNSQAKFAPIESLTSGNPAVTPISPHELPTSPHVLETKSSSNQYEPSLNKPVPVSGYPPFLNQAQQQQQPIYVVYTGQAPFMTGNAPMTLPAYQHMNQIHYQLPPQTYPVYYRPVEQYNSRYVQAPPVRHNTAALNIHQVDSPVARTSSPLAPEFSSQVYLPPKPVDSSSSVQASGEAAVTTTCKDDFSYNADLDDDTARAQIYKSQPPAPIVSSELQTMMLTEALGQLNTHNG